MILAEVVTAGVLLAVAALAILCAVLVTRHLTADDRRYTRSLKKERHP